ncbi:hypothetical protein ACIQUF_07135 [Pseudomonas sp. NPDC090233]|uniref:hypothetical protein n=1 Tax=Pseudomonas sp. NPDC090233 TaxID=3364479 RepID=UPI00383A9E2A
MPILWLFNPSNETNIKPKASHQIYDISNHVISIRNPWVTDSVFMGKLYTAMTITLSLLIYGDLSTSDLQQTLNRDVELLLMYVLAPLILTPFIAYRIYFIRNLSNIYLNRATKQIHYKRDSKHFLFQWNSIAGGLLRRREFGGASFSTSYALALAPRREDGTLHQKDCFWIDSNEPTEPDIQYVAEVWEYLRHFMDHGPDKLPPPGEPNWLYRPLHEICLTPAQAWRHYAPWRTGEPGEMQGKKNWQLPFWAVLFPYNITLAIAWYGICRLFNVRAAAAPPEAFEEAPVQPNRKKRK